MSERANNLTTLGTNALLIGAGVFLVWKILSKVGGIAADSAQKVADFVAGPIGATIAWWVVGAPVSVSSKFVIQPSGAIVDPNSFPIQFVKIAGATSQYGNNEVPIVTVNKVRYLVGPRDARGNYPLVSASMLMF